MVERWSFLSIYETCTMFYEIRILYFSPQKKKKEKKRWDDVFFSMEYHIYWLLKSPCFELFGDGKHGLFLAKMLTQRWYLFSLFERFMIFQDLGNTIFGVVLFYVPFFSVTQSLFLLGFSWSSDKITESNKERTYKKEPKKIL